jgi:hypothetical protein
MGIGYEADSVFGNNATPLGPYQVVRYFQVCLNAAGSAIEFTEESGMPRQLYHAKRLLTACGYCHQEVVAVIKEYCTDDWWVQNQPDLAQVVKQADKLRARIAGKLGADTSSWEEFEQWRATL